MKFTLQAMLSFALYLLAGGVALAVLGLVLWWMLPAALPFPPYLVTGILAVICGGIELWRSRSDARRP